MIVEKAEIESVLISNNTTQKMYINGEWVLSESGQTSSVINPANGEVIGTVTHGSAEDAKKAIEAAKNTFYKNGWIKSSAREREPSFFSKSLIN